MLQPPLPTVAAYGCSLRLQPSVAASATYGCSLLHTVAASITYGCSLLHTVAGRARPKSQSFSRPVAGWSSRLAGLTSRCSAPPIPRGAGCGALGCRLQCIGLQALKCIGLQGGGLRAAGSSNVGLQGGGLRAAGLVPQCWRASRVQVGERRQQVGAPKK